MELDFAEVLLQVMERNASDLHLTAGSPPMIRQHGKLHALDYPLLTPQPPREVVYSILTNDQRQKLETDWQIDFAYAIPGVAMPRAPVSQEPSARRHRCWEASKPLRLADIRGWNPRRNTCRWRARVAVAQRPPAVRNT